jgi:hypothetical protein
MMGKISLSVLVFLFCALGVNAQNSCGSIQTALASVFDSPTFRVAEVTQKPECFDGAFFRVVGIYRVSFENSDLYDPKDEKARAWLSTERFHSAVKRCSGDALKSLNRELGGTWGFTALGIMNTRGRFGHLGGWENQFDVICIENAELLSKEGNVFSSQPTAVQNRIVDWLNKIRPIRGSGD